MIDWVSERHVNWPSLSFRTAHYLKPRSLLVLLPRICYRKRDQCCTRLAAEPSQADHLSFAEILSCVGRILLATVGLYSVNRILLAHSEETCKDSVTYIHHTTCMFLLPKLLLHPLFYLLYLHYRASCRFKRWCWTHNLFVTGEQLVNSKFTTHCPRAPY